VRDHDQVNREQGKVRAVGNIVDDMERAIGSDLGLVSFLGCFYKLIYMAPYAPWHSKRTAARTELIALGLVRASQL
jgi:hypothetical protein